MVAPRGSCVVAAGGVCMVAAGGCLVAPGGCAWLLWGERHVWFLGGACMVALGGTCVAAPGGGMHGCSGGHAWLLGGMCGCSWGGGHAWDTTSYGDTINERAVRILLECILVGKSFLSILRLISVCVNKPLQSYLRVFWFCCASLRDFSRVCKYRHVVPGPVIYK